MVTTKTRRNKNREQARHSAQSVLWPLDMSSLGSVNGGVMKKGGSP